MENILQQLRGPVSEFSVHPVGNAPETGPQLVRANDGGRAAQLERGPDDMLARGHLVSTYLWLKVYLQYCK